MEISTFSRSTGIQPVKDKLFKAFAEGNLLPLAVLDEDLRTLTANPLFCKTLGLPCPKPLCNFQLSLLPFADNENFSSFLKQMLQNEKPAAEFIFTYQSLDDTQKHLRIKLVRLAEDGELRGVAIALYDLTHTHKKEALLQAKIKDLTQQNLEKQRLIDTSFQVENFAYIAAHDLREPLRTIGNFSQLLAKRCQDQLDTIAKEYLEYIHLGVCSMDSLINDIMAYVRLENHDHLAQEVNLSNLFFLLEKEFEQEFLRLGVQLTVDVKSQKIVGCREKFKALFTHLLANCLKFRKPKEPLEITIRENLIDHKWHFSVADNGIGIPSEFHEKIFLMFKKLHSKGNYDGNGIGLAICKKIVEQHGGRIWVESEVGKGTTIHFTIEKPIDWLELNSLIIEF